MIKALPTIAARHRPRNKAASGARRRKAITPPSTSRGAHASAREISEPGHGDQLRMLNKPGVTRTLVQVGVASICQMLEYRHLMGRGTSEGSPVVGNQECAGAPQAQGQRFPPVPSRGAATISSASAAYPTMPPSRVCKGLSAVKPNQRRGGAFKGSALSAQAPAAGRTLLIERPLREAVLNLAADGEDRAGIGDPDHPVEEEVGGQQDARHQDRGGDDAEGGGP